MTGCKSADQTFVLLFATVTPKKDTGRTRRPAGGYATLRPTLTEQLMATVVTPEGPAVGLDCTM